MCGFWESLGVLDANGTQFVRVGFISNGIHGFILSWCRCDNSLAGYLLQDVNLIFDLQMCGMEGIRRLHEEMQIWEPDTILNIRISITEWLPICSIGAGGGL